MHLILRKFFNEQLIRSEFRRHCQEREIHVKYSFSRNAKTANQQNPNGQTQGTYPAAGVRSATQNQKRTIQPNKRFFYYISRNTQFLILFI